MTLTSCAVLIVASRLGECGRDIVVTKWAPVLYKWLIDFETRHLKKAEQRLRTSPEHPHPLQQSPRTDIVTCHDLGSLSSSCRKLQSLRALTAKAPSTHQLSVWNKQSGSIERTKLCLSSLVMKRGLICRWGPLFSKLKKINLKQQPGVEQGWCDLLHFEWAPSGEDNNTKHMIVTHGLKSKIMCLAEVYNLLMLLFIIKGAVSP